MKKILFILTFGFIFAQTNISGTISDAVLTSDGNPYMMIGDVYCEDCTLLEGVEIIVTGQYRLNIPTGHNMYVYGTSESPVIIRGLSGGSGSWYGINIFAGSMTELIAEHFHLSDAVDGILLGSSPGSYTSLALFDSIIKNCSESGVTLEGTSTSGFVLRNNLIKDNQVGIELSGGGSNQSLAWIINNTIVSNGTGIDTFNSGGGFVDVNSNFISFNDGYGIGGNGHIEAPRLKYNDFYGNGIGDLEYDYSVVSGLGDFGFESDEATNLNGHPSDVGMNIYANPNFVDMIHYRLQEGSMQQISN